jgi:hypothetical protein
METENDNMEARKEEHAVQRGCSQYAPLTLLVILPEFLQMFDVGFVHRIEFI